MRSPRPSRIGPLVAAGLSLVLAVLPTSAGAQDQPGPGPADAAPMEAPAGSDLPTGFLDGVPVGDPVPVADTPAPGGPQARATTAVTQRYFGDGPWTAIRAAATNAPRPCSVSVDDVVAMMTSPVFKESSAATTASSSPSPMTLSRADEWTTGVYATNTNLNANYGLYENRNPDSPYQRAYWHPGIGIWQYDSAGVGAPFTAIERMDVNIVGADVAKGMIQRYCASSATDAFAKRRAAWSPWGTACTTATAADNLCEREFQAMTGSTPKFANITPVAGVSATGGAVQRSCTVDGATVACWYVDPAQAQGSKGWTFTPTGAPDWSSRPTPLAFPFYVLKRNGQEERHWLKADTGYPVDIAARRAMGKNGRPRSNQAGSGLTWSRSTTLCDRTTGRGQCGGTDPEPPVDPPGGPAAPSGLQSTPVPVRGDYAPMVLDLNGDGLDDVFWYGPGDAPDAIWLATGPATFRAVDVNVRGVYEPRTLDANGDGRDDILWYHPSGDAASVWISNGDGTFAARAYQPGRGHIPLIIDRDGNGTDEILWYGPGATSDVWWQWNGLKYMGSTTNVSGTYRPIVGDFDGNGLDDVFWYGPGSAPDALWLHRPAGGYNQINHSIGGDYRPQVGDFDGDGRDDIVWYQPGSTTEYVWWGIPGGTFASQAFVVNDDYTPVVVDLDHDGRGDIVWYAPDGTGHLWTRWSADRTRSSVSLTIGAGYRPLAGRFSPGGRDGLYWYGPGSTPDALWWK